MKKITMLALLMAVSAGAVHSAEFSELQGFKISAPAPYALEVISVPADIDATASFMLSSMADSVDTYCAKLLKMDATNPAFQIAVGKLIGSVEVLVQNATMYEVGYLGMYATTNKLAEGVIQSQNVSSLIQSIRKQNAELLKKLNLHVVVAPSR